MRTAGFLIALAGLSLAGCSDLCGNKVIAEELSPDLNFKAVIFERNCGATTAFSTQVSVLEASEKLTGGGNVFVSDGGQASEGWNGPWVAVKWLGSDSLQIAYDSTGRVFEQDKSVDGVSISYLAVERPAL